MVSLPRLRVQANQQIDNLESMIICLSSNLGLVLVVMGAAHFFNMLVIHRFREPGLRQTRRPQFSDHA